MKLHVHMEDGQMVTFSALELLALAKEVVEERLKKSREESKIEVPDWEGLEIEADNLFEKWMQDVTSSLENDYDLPHSRIFKWLACIQDSGVVDHVSGRMAAVWRDAAVSREGAEVHEDFLVLLGGLVLDSENTQNHTEDNISTFQNTSYLSSEETEEKTHLSLQASDFLSGVALPVVEGLRGIEAWLGVADHAWKHRDRNVVAQWFDVGGRLLRLRNMEPAHQNDVASKLNGSFEHYLKEKVIQPCLEKVKVCFPSSDERVFFMLNRFLNWYKRLDPLRDAELFDAFASWMTPEVARSPERSMLLMLSLSCDDINLKHVVKGRMSWQDLSDVVGTRGVDASLPICDVSDIDTRRRNYVEHWRKLQAHYFKEFIEYKQNAIDKSVSDLKTDESPYPDMSFEDTVCHFARAWYVLSEGDKVHKAAPLVGQGKNFYVTDHGKSADFHLPIRGSLDLLGSQDPMGVLCQLNKFSQWYNGLTSAQQKHLSLEFTQTLEQTQSPLASQHQLEVLLGLSCREEDRQGALQLDGSWVGMRDKHSLPESKETKSPEFNHLVEQARYLSDMLINGVDLNWWGGIVLSTLRNWVDSIMHPSDASQYLLTYLFHQQAKLMRSGDHRFLCRQLQAYGDAVDGASYPEFADTIGQFMESHSDVTDSQLAHEMRRLLQGEQAREGMGFLPCLTAAWFIAEAGRNRLTTLTTLMLLDLIESGVRLEGSGRGACYTWQNVLVHPLQDGEVKQEASNAYGQPIEPYKVGGYAPPTHSGSGRRGKKLPKLEAELSILRQKEAHLLIHWLAQKWSRDREGGCFQGIAKMSPEVGCVDRRFKTCQSVAKLDKKIESYGDDSQKLWYETKKRVREECLKPLLQGRLAHLNFGLGCSEDVQHDSKSEEPPFHGNDPRADHVGFGYPHASCESDDAEQVPNAMLGRA